MHPFYSFRDVLTVCPLFVKYLTVDHSLIASMNFNDHLAISGKRACEGN